MKVTTENSDTMAAERNDITSTAQKDSSSDNASVDSAESSEAVVPSPSNVQAVNVPTSTVQTANVSTLTVVPVYTRPFKPVTATGTANTHDARRLVVPNATLHYDTVHAAIGNGLMGRKAITIENDDVAVVKIDANSQVWVNKLVSAFTIDYLSTPEDTTKNTKAQREWFTRWQKQAHATLVTIINGKDPNHLEQSCWFLLKAVLNAHELGIVDAGGNLNPSKTKCSERLAFIVSIMEKYALVRLDVVRAWHVDEIAANPEAFIKRKLVNCWNNGHRAEKAKAEKEAKKAKAEAEKEAKKVASTKRKAGKSVEEDEESEVETPVKAKKARKSKAKADAADEGAKKGGKSNSKTTNKTKTTTKHSHTALTPDSEDKESTPTKRSAVLKAKAKASSADAVKDNAGDAVDDLDEA